jgi:PAS domain S-box-containing protein
VILKERLDVIADDWHRAIDLVCFIPNNRSEVHRQFIRMTQNIIDLLLEETMDRTRARAVGEMLVDMHCMQPEALGKTQEILAQKLAEGIPPDIASELHSRLVILLAELSTGFSLSVRRIILGQQEQIRAAVEKAHQRAEAVRQKAELRNRAILEAQPDIMTIVNLNGDYVDFHTNYPRNPNIDPNDVPGRNMREFVPEDVVEKVLERCRVVIQTGKMQIIELALNQDETTYYEARIVPYMEDQVLMIARDITQKKQAEEALKESEARYRAVVEDQTELIARWLPDTTITFVNKAYCRYFQTTPEECVGKRFSYRIYEEDLPIFKEHLSRITSLTPESPIAVVELRVIVDGRNEPRWQQWIDRAIFNEEGQLIEYQSVGRDITDVKKTDETLKQTNAQLQMMARQLISAQEYERHHIALELHDDVLSLLGAMMMTVDNQMLPDSFQQNYLELTAKLRNTISGLRPPMLNFGLHAALGELCDDLCDLAPNGTCPRLIVSPNPVRFDPNVELHVFRIVQQACDNALRHAKATDIRIEGVIEADLVDLSITDDGVGFDAEKQMDLVQALANQHYGLAGMLERGALIGAQVNISTQPVNGTRIRIIWKPEMNEEKTL